MTQESQNRVDELREANKPRTKEISKLQSECVHKYETTAKEVRLPISDVASVFIGRYEYYLQRMGYVRHTKVRCENCSRFQNFLVNKFCPRCLGTMVKGENIKPEKYLPLSYLKRFEKNHAPEMHLYSCGGCGLKLVA